MYEFLALILGMCVGSFSNVCIYRWLKGESVVFKPSHCRTCETPIKWYDNIPLFSWIMLGGKCRHCGTPISVQYPFVEVITGLAYLLIFQKYGMVWESVLLMFTTWIFVVATISDIRQMEIPDELTIAALLFAPINWFFGNIELVQIAMGIVPAVFVYVLALFLSHRNGGDFPIGGGDLKFLFSLGILHGFMLPLAVLQIGAIMIGLIFINVLVSDLSKGERTPVPMMAGFFPAYVYLFLMNFQVLGIPII